MPSTREIYENGHRAFNDHDIDALMEMYADGAEFRGPGKVLLRGKDAIRQFTEGWFQGFPDARLETVSLITTDTHIVEEGIFHGTHTGTFPTPMGDLPATGRSVSGSFVDVFEIRDGKVVSDHLSFDRAELMEQLGLIPEPATA
jgi:steroid delta-isomerase-like uncharacterized protein